jgi:hypothetical protein
MIERGGGGLVELPDLIRANQLVRGRIDLDGFGRWYDALLPDQRVTLGDTVLGLARQAGVLDADYDEALAVAGVPADHPVARRVSEARQERHFPFMSAARLLPTLDDGDMRVAFRLFAALFGIAEGRVYRRETPGCCNHWWHRDLLDDRVVQDLLADPNYSRTAMRDDDRLKPRLTEFEWLSATEPRRMLEFVRGRTTPGKYRSAYLTLFARRWGTLTADVPDPFHALHALDGTPPPPPALYPVDNESLRAIRRLGRRCCEFVRRGGGLLEEVERAGLYREVEAVAVPGLRDCLAALVAPDAELGAAVVRGIRALGQSSGGVTDGYLLRELFGNPFRPVVLDPSWLTSDVIALARGIRQDRAFERMPILADALQDAGCADRRLLDHLRHGCLFHVVTGDRVRIGWSHRRGCWALHLILGEHGPTDTEPADRHRELVPTAGEVPPHLRLLGLNDVFTSREWSFHGPFEVGRAAGGLALAEAESPSASRRHAAFWHDDARWWVADLGSTNGTYRNGDRIGKEPAGPLRAGDLLRFGDIAFQVAFCFPQ